MSDPSRYAPLSMFQIFTGLWTNRSPLRDAATPYLQQKFYSATRQDSIIDGQNVEVTSRLTLARRPGHSVYNTQTFPAIDRFYGFRRFSPTVEQILVMADTAGAVYDATGPNIKNAIWQKSAGASRTTFQSVGNTLYFGNGVDQKKWVTSTLAWAALTTFNAGDRIVDSNNNLQVAAAAMSATIVSLAIKSGIATMTFTTYSTFPPGAPMNLAGLTTQTSLNGTSPVVLTSSGNAITFATTIADTASAAETGAASTVAPTITGNAQPVWSTVVGAGTVDGAIIWINKSGAVSEWMFDGPPNAPTLAQAKLPQTHPLWSANTIYSTSLQIVDAAGNIQKLTTGGITGSAEPMWNATLGGTTTDGTAIWTNAGSATWVAAHTYAVGDVVSAKFTYYIEVPAGGNPDDPEEEPGYPGKPAFILVPVTVTDFFVCTTAGTSGAAHPIWVDGNGSLVQDKTVLWTNQGTSQSWTDAVGATENVVLSQVIVDSNGNLETISYSGKSGATEPTWATASGAVTSDNTAIWVNGGSYSSANTDAWIYSYSFGNSVTGDESNRSPLSASITLGTNSLVNVQGFGSNDPQVDTIFIYRTLQGGSSQLRLDSIPAPPGSNSLWTYSDTGNDSALNPFILASTTNYKPPTGLTALTYHLSLMWGAIDNVVYFTVPPSAQVGVNVSCFPPLNSFTFPSRVVRLWATSIGLLVFTVSDVYIISGTNTAGDPLISDIYVNGLGLLSYDALAVNATTLYMLTTDQQVLSLDPGSGITEVGFPIADLLEAGGPAYTSEPYNPEITGFDPALSYLAFHSQGSRDKGLYVADGNTGWFRMSPVTAPESGFAWSPKADVVGGCQAVSSVEVLPGIRRLLVGPVGEGQILQRDLSVNTDNGVTFPAAVTFGNIVLAQEGQMAGLHFISARTFKRGTQPTIGVLLGEVDGTFENLKRTVQEPPLLPPSTSLYSDRYNLSQSQEPIWCHHFQMSINWAAEDAANELLSFTIFGELRSEFKS
jgi:hypothetical protein